MRPGCEGLADTADLGIKTHLWLYHTLPRNLRIRLVIRPIKKGPSLQQFVKGHV